MKVPLTEAPVAQSVERLTANPKTLAGPRFVPSQSGYFFGPSVHAAVMVAGGTWSL